MNQLSLIEDTVAAYRLRAFPYVLRELDPSRDAEDLGLLCRVAGWEAAEAIGDFLASRVATRQQALVVVVGGSGTGRTSLANYAISKWADARASAHSGNFDPEKLIVAHGRMNDYSDAKQMWQWVLDLWPQVLAAGFEPSDVTERAFDALRAAEPAAMASALQNTLLKLTNDLYSKRWALAGVLEDVKKQELLTLARDSFKYVDSLLVTTVEDTAGNFDAVLANVEQALPIESSRFCKLGEVDGAEARQVVITRWHKYSDQPPPFSEQAVEEGSPADDAP